MDYETWNRNTRRTVTARFVNRAWPEGIIAVKMDGVLYGTALASVEEAARQVLWERYGKTGGHMCAVNIHIDDRAVSGEPALRFALCLTY